MSSVRPLRACVSSEAWRLARGRGVRAGLRAAGAAGGVGGPLMLKGSLKGSVGSRVSRAPVRANIIRSTYMLVPP